MPRDPFSRWRYSTRILFSGCDQATYQQDLVIHRTAGQDYEKASGGLKVWHIYIGPRCRPDYGDLRFSDRYGRELAYYLWPDHDAESARFTVRLEGADQSGALAIWHGNPTATTTSDENNVFLLFDNFDGESLDTSIWTNSGNSGEVTIENGKAIIRASASSGVNHNRYITSANPLSDSVSVFIRAKYQTAGRYGLNIAVGRSARNHYGSPYIGASYFETQAPSTTRGWHRDSTNLGGSVAVTNYNEYRFDIHDSKADYWLNGNQIFSNRPISFSTFPYVELYVSTWDSGNTVRLYVDYVLVRAYSATPPSLLQTSRGVNPAYAGLVGALPDDVIRFAGIGSIQVFDGTEVIAGAGSFAVETSVRSPISIAGTARVETGFNLMPTPAALSGTGSISSEPVHLRTPLDMEGGEGLAYVAPTPVQFDVWQYRFESLEISRSAQDALWRCDGQIEGLQAPLAYKSFTVRVPDHNGVLRTIFFGFVPGRDYVQAVAANKSTVQGFDAGFYLTRQYLPNGDLYYPAAFLWTPMNLIKYWLGEETTQAGSPSYWERVSGIMPYRIHGPITEGHSYTPKDWNFQPKTTKVQAIQEVCEYAGMVFLVKWRSVNGAMTPCAYLVHQDDIDDPYHGLDLPAMVTFTHPDPCIANGVQATLQSDEKYNRIEVRSASPSGAWFHAVRETPALKSGDELPIEYLEERSDLPIDADHGGWCNARANELYAYYTKYAYTYTLTLINRVDLELYQRCRFYGFDAIPSGEMMRIVAIRYNVRPTHTEVEITVTPNSRLSDLRRLQRSQAADSVSEMQVIARSQINQMAAGEVGTVVGIDGAEAIVELERRADSSVRGRIV